MSALRAESSRADLVQRALASCGRAVLRRGPASWRLVLANGKPFPATAALEGDWLVLAAPRPDWPPGWELMGRLAALPGGVKAALPPGAAHVHLRGELPLDGDRPLGDTVASACAALCAGMSTDLVGAAEPPERGESGPAAAPGPSFSIEVRGQRWPARVMATASGTLARLTLAPLGAPAAPSRAALALLLLRGADLLLGVRTALCFGAAGAEAVAEWPLRSDPAAACLAEAAEALGAAVAVLGRETRALADDGLARAYLAARPGPANADSAPAPPPRRRQAAGNGAPRA
ncbi:MAG TPA: hypothetical protein VMT16_14385 [Thermoanaerobaculia bacterium]|nr:hypothetical protein [Thermoanaerobaculia bacterium]